MRDKSHVNRGLFDPYNLGSTAYLTTLIRSLAAVLLAACLSGVLGGCAGVASVSATAADREKILMVRIDPMIELPAKPYYQGPEQAFAAVAGVVGAMLAAPDAADAASKMAAVMHDQHTEISGIVLAEFPSAWETGTPVRFTNDPSAAVDGVMTLKINTWGIGQSQGFNPKLYPLLGISATLKRADGTVAWQKYDFVTPANKDNNEGHTFDEYHAKPELFKRVFDSATRIVSSMLLQSYEH